MQTNIRWLDGLVLTLVLAAFGLMFGRLVSSEHFAYDESDYMYAASKGFVASYLDRPSLSIIDFVRTGIRSGRHSAERRNLSEYIRQQDDITFYRHFHAPLYFYWLEFIRTLSGPKEAAVRWASLLSFMLAAVIMYFGSLALAGRQGRFVGLIAICFLLLSPANIDTARWITPHSLYMACAMASLFFLARLVQTKQLRFLYGALVCLGLAFLTIEYAPLLLVVLLATVWMHRAALFPNWPRQKLFRFSLKCAAIPLVVIGVLWPAGLYKLSLVKSYAFFVYFATVRAQTYGTQPVSAVWWTRIVSSPLEYSLLFALTCYFVYVFVRKQELRYLSPFLLYAALMFLTTVRNRSGSSDYVSSLIPCLAFISAFAMSLLLDARSKLRVPIAALLVFGLAVNNAYSFSVVSRPTDERLTAIVNILQESGVRGERLLVPHAYRPTIHYYFQGTNLTGYDSYDPANEKQSTEMFQRLVDGNFDGVVYEGSEYEGLRSRLEKNWSVRSVIKAEPDRPGRAMAYYSLKSPADMAGRTTRESGRGTRYETSIAR